MYHSRGDRYYKFRLVSVFTITSLFLFSGDGVFAQISKDSTLGVENSLVTPNSPSNPTIYQIDGGTIRGNNLFHSFEQFSVPTGTTAYFNNATNIQNIISRVTGTAISNIDGILKTNGTANLFLINPNGIIFGSRAALDIQGSFLASTASSINFANNFQFSATNPQPVPLLTVTVPIGLQFGSKAEPIRNQSQASLGGAKNRTGRSAGLQVPLNKTLALVGGDLTLEGGNLTAKEGRIELGSVGANSLVNLQFTGQGLALGYENVRDFQNIKLTPLTTGNITNPSQVDVSGEGSGSIYVQGKQLLITGTSQLLANTLGAKNGGNLVINTSESVELVGPNSSILTTLTFGSGNAGDLEIYTGKLILRNLAQVQAGARFPNSAANQPGLLGLGSGGKLIINATESVFLTGSIPLGREEVFSTGLFNATSDVGDAGDLIINTKILRLENGARISNDSGGRTLTAGSNQFLPATGNSGHLIINATELVEIIGTSSNNFPSALLTRTRGTGRAGELSLTTGKLIVRDGGAISVSSAIPRSVVYLGDPTKLGAAGDINIDARSIYLDHKGVILAESEAGKGGNIHLRVRDLLFMRQNSLISANAGKTLRQGDGGNINIDAANGFIVGVPLGNSDITANAFDGSGGKVTINVKSIFEFVPHTSADLAKLLGTENPEELNPANLPTNDITAVSQTNPTLSGQVIINTPDVDPDKGLVELPIDVVTSSEQIASNCNYSSNSQASSFFITGRGGIIPSPTDTLTDDAVLTNWIQFPGARENNTDQIKQHKGENTPKLPSGDRSSQPPEIIEAQGWMVDANGNLVLIAQPTNTTPHSPAIKRIVCAVEGR